jgi:multiple sugar transport system substrate-binding protein
LKLSNHNWSAYLTATLIILPVLVLLAACQSSPRPTASAAVTLTQMGTATPSVIPLVSQTVTPQGEVLTPFQKQTATACQGSPCFTPTPTSTVTPTSTSSLGAEPTGLRGTTLQFWYVAQAGDAVGILPALVSEFNKSNSWGVRVEISAFDSAGLLTEQVRNTLYSGKLPDVLAGYSYQGTSWDKNANTLVDLNAYINDPVWGLSAQDQADFYPSVWTQANPGKRLGIPLHRTALGLYYNVTWAKELGFSTPPKTPQEFEQQACAAAKKNGDETGGWLITPETTTLVAWMFAFDGSLTRADQKGYQIDTPVNLQALIFLKKLQTQGCAWTTTQLHPLAEFADRKALFVIGDTSGIASQEAAIKSIGKGDQWTVLPFPVEPTSSGSDRVPLVMVHGPDLMITHTTPERQMAAWFFARWLISPEIQSRWVRADGSCPVRVATLDRLKDYAAVHPQWTSLVQSLDQARVEPAYASWEIIRWVFTDAAVQLFSPTFTENGIPDLLKMLEKTAEEANVQIR